MKHSLSGLLSEAQGAFDIRNEACVAWTSKPAANESNNRINGARRYGTAMGRCARLLIPLRCSFSTVLKRQLHRG
jgi:hypothetical protein